MKIHNTNRYVFQLFVTGHSSLSNRAIINVRKFCEEHLAGPYDLEIVDVSEQPELAVEEQVLAAPTLIKHLPTPLRRFIGDMSQTDRILLGLKVRPADD